MGPQSNITWQHRVLMRQWRVSLASLWHQMPALFVLKLKDRAFVKPAFSRQASLSGLVISFFKSGISWKARENMNFEWKSLYWSTVRYNNTNSCLLLLAATVGLGGLMASNCEAHLDALSVLLKYKELIKTSSSNSMIKFNENINWVFKKKNIHCCYSWI